MHIKCLTAAILLFLSSVCYTQNPAFPTEVSKNGRYFIDQNEKPFLYHVTATATEDKAIFVPTCLSLVQLQ